jgi:hypothetical protein
MNFGSGFAFANYRSFFTAERATSVSRVAPKTTPSEQISIRPRFRFEIASPLDQLTVTGLNAFSHARNLWLAK